MLETEREMNYRLKIPPSPLRDRSGNTLLPLVYVVRSLKGREALLRQEGPSSQPAGYPNTFATCPHPHFHKGAWQLLTGKPVNVSRMLLIPCKLNTYIRRSVNNSQPSFPPGATRPCH